MADIVDRKTRSRMMAGIRGRDTKPELRVRRYLHRAGLRFRLHDRRLPGRPDIVLPRFRTVVFVHGCFWHQHPGCRFAYMPTSNRQFWQEKLSRNVNRDRERQANLASVGWRVIVVWECETKSEDHLTEVARIIRSPFLPPRPAADVH
jgi:DNA mismatch endonuclease, patch repair protein